MNRSSLATLVNSRLMVISSATGYVAVERHFLAAALADYVAGIDLDGAWYLSQNPDVEAAIAQGAVSGVADHYRRFGWWENRMPYAIAVDETWYRRSYPDVEQAIARRTFHSGQEHYEFTGYREGRFPFPNFELRTVGAKALGPSVPA